MKIPEDWDLPSGENEKRCELFSGGIFGIKPGMPYRLYTPKTDRKVPLIVYIHGADAFGRDNELQLNMHDIGTILADSTWQDVHPCFILAPQCGPGSSAYHEQASDTIVKIVKELIRQNPLIDTDRLYIYGYSAGAAKTYSILKRYPGLFAAATAICGATDRLGIEKLTEVPLCMIHARDDSIVRASYKTASEPHPVILGSADLYDELKDLSDDMIFRDYPSGYMKEHYGINPHCTWVPAGEDTAMWEWMFGHSQV